MKTCDQKLMCAFCGKQLCYPNIEDPYGHCHFNGHYAFVDGIMCMKCYDDCPGQTQLEQAQYENDYICDPQNSRSKHKINNPSIACALKIQ